MFQFGLHPRVVMLALTGVVCTLLAAGCSSPPEEAQPVATTTAGSSAPAVSPQVQATIQAAERADVAQRAARAAQVGQK